jgi:hypothetical protein
MEDDDIIKKEQHLSYKAAKLRSVENSDVRKKNEGKHMTFILLI